MKIKHIQLKRFFNTDYFFANLFLFISIALLGLITFNLSFFDPVKKALSDFNFSDLLYSELHTGQQNLDTNIILVNIGQLNRAEIARQLERIREQKPKVIGFDGFFQILRDSETDEFLNHELSKEHNLVMASYLHSENIKTGLFDSIELSNPYFNSGLTGFVNLGGANPETSTVRKFSSKEIFNHDTLYSLTAKLAMIYDPDAFSRLIKRDKKREIIKYRGNIEAFGRFDAYEVLDSLTDLSIIKNKIVLMGYMGPSFSSHNDLEDIYFTPLNKELNGRSHPDMYGVVIHANILSMILAQDYINEMPVWLSILLAFMISYFYIIFLMWFSKKHSLASNLTFPFLLLGFNALLVYVFFLCYKYFDLSINSGYFLAPIFLFKTFKTYYERVLTLINHKFKIKSNFVINE